MQLPLNFPLCIGEYLQFLKRPTLKCWSMPCPLCGAEHCAQFLCCYTRRYIYYLGMVYENVKIVRFICNRLNPQVLAGTHRTFSLLPVFLIPYCRYSLDLTMAIAEGLTQHAGNVYQTTGVLTSEYGITMNFNATTIARIKMRLQEVRLKLNKLPAKMQKAIGWSRDKKRLSDLVGFIQSYQSQVHKTLRNAHALSYDWFYRFHQERLYMERDFLFGTASQLRL